MRKTSSKLAWILLLAVGTLAGSAAELRAIETDPVYNDPCALVDPEFQDMCAGGGGPTWNACWDCARKGLAPINLEICCCRGATCDNLAKNGFTIQNQNLLTCQAKYAGNTGSCVGPECD